MSLFLLRQVPRRARPAALLAARLGALAATALSAAHCEGAPFTAIADGGDDGGADATSDARGDAGLAADVVVRFDGATTLAGGQTLPRGIAVDDTRLFWVDAQDPGGGLGAVRSMNKNGSGAVATIAMSQPSPLDIGAGLESIFWSVNVGGSPPAVSQCLAMTSGKAAGGSTTCFTAAADSTARMALSALGVVLLVADAVGPRVGYATAVDGVFKSVPAQGPSEAIAASDSEVYVGNANGTHVDDFSLPGLAVGTGVCMNGCGAGAIVDMGVDGVGNVLWVTSGGSVVTAPIQTTNLQGHLLGTVAGAPQRMTRDASFVYVTTATPPTGAIVAVPIGGGVPSTLAAGEVGPFGIAVDGQNVYWTCADGKIRAIGVPAP